MPDALPPAAAADAAPGYEPPVSGAAMATVAAGAGAAAPAVDMRALDRSLLRGVAWTGAVKWVTQVLTWVSTIVVARFLSPADYGLVGMATVYLGLTALVTEFGLGSAVVASPSLDHRQLRQVNAFAVLIGVVAMIVSCLAAPLLARFFRAPDLLPVIIVLSTGFVIDAFRTVPVALLTRQMNFRSIALVEGVKAVFAAALTVALAIGGARHWSLVLGNLAASLLFSGVIVARHGLGFARPRLGVLREVLAFSAQLLVGRIAWFGYSNADFVIAGRVLGQSALGAYTYAWTLASTPGEKVMGVFARVAPSTFTAVLNDPVAMRRYLLGLTGSLAIAIFPATIGLALVADDFVRLVLGERWMSAVAPLRLLCVYAAFHMISTLLPHVLNVTGHAAYAMRNGLYAVAILPPAFYFAGQRWGTTGIAWVWVLVYPCLIMPVWLKVCRTIGMRRRDYLASLWPAVNGTVVMTLAVLAVRAMLPPDLGPALRLVAGSTTGALAYGATGWWLHRERLRALIATVRRAAA